MMNSHLFREGSIRIANILVQSPLVVIKHTFAAEHICVRWDPPRVESSACLHPRRRPKNVFWFEGLEPGAPAALK